MFEYTPPSDPFKAPFIHIRYEDGKTKWRGAKSHFEGHRFSARPGERPHGVFATWEWDGETLRAECDGLGFWPLFYAVASREIWLSPSIAVLLREGAPAELDLAVVGVFARWNCLVSDRTFFRAVRTMPRGGQLRWSRGQHTAEDHIPVVRPSTLSRDAAVDAYIELVRASVNRHLEAFPVGPWLVTLSGGRDSRHLFLEMVRSGASSITCFTTDRTDVYSGEGRIAAELARRCSAEHRIVQRAWPSVHDEVKILQLTQLHAAEHVWLLNLAETVGQHAGVVVDGVGTESFLKPSGLFSPKLRALLDSGRLDEVVAEMPQSRLMFASCPFARPEEWEAEGCQLLVDELRRHIGTPNPSGSFRFWNRMRRTIPWSPFRLFAQRNAVFAPYLDSDLVSFASSIPTPLVMGSDIRSEAIARAFPEFSDVPFEAHSPPQRDLYPWKVRARMAKDLMALLISMPRSRRIQDSHLFLRLIRTIGDPHYRSIEWFAAPVLRTLMLGTWAAGDVDGNFDAR